MEIWGCVLSARAFDALLYITRSAQGDRTPDMRHPHDCLHQSNRDRASSRSYTFSQNPKSIRSVAELVSMSVSVSVSTSSVLRFIVRHSFRHVYENDAFAVKSESIAARIASHFDDRRSLK